MDSHLFISEIRDVVPLDLQMGVYPTATVPDDIFMSLFGAPNLFEMEVEEHGGENSVPELRTYLIADAYHFPDFARDLGDPELQKMCLFEGEAAKSLSDVAPYLVELKNDLEFTRKLFTFLEGFDRDASLHHWHRPFGVFVRSRATFNLVRKHLRHFTKLQDANGRWFFRRFWDTEHSHAWLPLLKDELLIAARFFGHVKGNKTPMVHSYHVLSSPRQSLLSATWNPDKFQDKSMQSQLPAGRQQQLDIAYIALLKRASLSVSLTKTVRYLRKTFPERYGADAMNQSAVETVALETREIGRQFGISSEVGWARTANIATYLGIGFLDDPRFNARGLSREQIGRDSQGEKLFAIGAECAKQIGKIDNTLGTALDTAFAMTPIDIVRAVVLQLDPSAEWNWGDVALARWCKSAALAAEAMGTAASTANFAALAYKFGLEFVTDPSLSFHETLTLTRGTDFDAALAVIFEKEFGAN